MFTAMFGIRSAFFLRRGGSGYESRVSNFSQDIIKILPDDAVVETLRLASAS
jgi:hypothetical protein